MRKIITLFSILFSFIVNTSFHKQERHQEVLAYKPTNNFDWLKEFFVFSKTVTIEGWTESPQLSFDSAGVVQVGVNKNPCTISEFALALFNKYIETNDEKYKKMFLAQVTWLIDPANYELLKHDMLGHSYKYPFHDLSPPWYGGLAEGEFMSVLIRYYKLTRDEQVLPVIIKTRNFLITPETDGGLLSKTPEGNVWIEEYGGSKQERHVLNGFFVTVISLYEYCQLFPGDRDAKAVLIDCYQSIKKSLKYYERNNWVTYNRGDYRLVINWYMKAQVIELEELYRISKDDFFKYQKMLWSTYVFEKPIGRPPGTCLIDNYNFSVPGTIDKGNIFPIVSYPDLTPVIFPKNIKASDGIKSDSINIIKDGNINNWMELSCDSTIKNSYYIDFTFDSTLIFDKISLVSVYADLLKDNINFLCQVKGENRWNEIKPSNILTSGNTVNISFEKMKSASLRLEMKRGLFNKGIRVNELRIHNSADYHAPEFSHITTGLYQSAIGSVNLSFEGIDVSDPVVYYKSAPDQTSLNNQVWTQEKSIKGNLVKINSPNDHFFQFLVIYKINSPASHLSAFTVK